MEKDHQGNPLISSKGNNVDSSNSSLLPLPPSQSPSSSSSPPPSSSSSSSSTAIGAGRGAEDINSGMHKKSTFVSADDNSNTHKKNTGSGEDDEAYARLIQDDENKQQQQRQQQQQQQQQFYYSTWSPQPALLPYPSYVVASNPGPSYYYGTWQGHRPVPYAVDTGRYEAVYWCIFLFFCFSFIVIFICLIYYY